MASKLRKRILRNGVINAVICLAFGLGTAKLTGIVELRGASLLWLCALSLGVGIFVVLRGAHRVKATFIRILRRRVSYVRIERDRVVGEQAIDWSTIDDYGVQLESRGFRSLGDYTLYPMSESLAGVAAVFVDASASTVVEVQQLKVLQPTSENGAVNGVHFSITSLVGGNIRVSTTDHVVMAANFMNRGENNVSASYPGMGLMALLNKHEQVLSTLQGRAGKSPSSGLDIVRYVLVCRENLRQARNRIHNTSAWAVVQQIDEFDAKPLTRWSPAAEWLRNLPTRTLRQLDATLKPDDHPPVMGMPQKAAVLPEAQHSVPDFTVVSEAHIENPYAAPEVLVTSSVSGVDSEDAEDLRERAVRGANWFYWIAALSLLNSVMLAFGSEWSFAVGLGISQIFGSLAGALKESAASPVSVGLMYVGSVAASGFFAFCGWFSRRPSVVAFAVGMAVFALDTLVFVYSMDYVGIGFHLFALFCLWGGYSAARQFRAPWAESVTRM